MVSNIKGWHGKFFGGSLIKLIQSIINSSSDPQPANLHQFGHWSLQTIDMKEMWRRRGHISVYPVWLWDNANPLKTSPWRWSANTANQLISLNPTDSNPSKQRQFIWRLNKKRNLIIVFPCYHVRLLWRFIILFFLFFLLCAFKYQYRVYSFPVPLIVEGFLAIPRV